MYNIFNSLTKQPLNSAVSVEAKFNTPSSATSQFDLVNAEPSILVYKNGVKTSVPFSIVSGDTLKITFNTSTEYSTATYVKYSIDGVLGVVGASTIDSTVVSLQPRFVGVSYFDSLTNSDGTQYVRNHENNKFIKLNLTDNTITNIMLSATPTGVEATNYSYIVQPFSQHIYKIDTDSNAVIKKIAVGNNPTGGANSTLPSGSNGKCIWITVTDDNKIVCLDSTDTQVFSINGFNRPLGIDTSADGKLIAVANNSSGSPSVSIVKWNGSSWVKNDVTLPSKPFYTYVDGNNNVWVSSQATNKTYHVDSTTNAVTEITTGKGQRALKSYDDVSVYVTAAEDGKLFKIDIGSKTVSKSWTIPEYPVDVAVTPAKIYVASGATSIYEIDAANAVKKYTTVDKNVYALDVDANGNLICASLFYDQPNFVDVIDSSTTEFYFDSPIKVSLNTTFESDTFTIADISGPMPVSVPNVLNAKLYVNGVALASTTGIIQPGDTFKFSIDAIGNDNDLLVFPFYMGSKMIMFNSTVKKVDVKVTPFYFTDVVSAVRSTQYETEEITIEFKPATGLLDMTVTNAVFIKNGVVGTNSITVANGDKIKLRATANTNYQKTDYFKVQAGNYQNVWSITTLADPNAFWLKPNELERGIFSADTSTATSYKLSKFTTVDSVLKTIDLETVPTNVHDDTLDYTYVVSYYNNKLYKVETDSFVVAATYTAFPAGSKPASIASVMNITYSFKSIAVTLSAANKVRILKNDFSSYYDLTTGTEPYGCCSNGTYLWVANKSSYSVSVYKFNDTTSVYEAFGTINVPNSVPYELYYDETTNVAYLTDLKGKVHVLSTTALIKSVTVGNTPWGLTVNSTYLYCANTYDNTVSRITLSDWSVSNFKLDFPPSSLTLDKDGNIYTTNIEDNIVRKYAPDFTYQSQFNTTLFNTWVNGSSYSTSIGVFVAHLHSDVVSSKLQLETAANSGNFLEQLSVPRSTIIKSNAITIANLIRPDTLYIEGYTEAAIILNDVVQPKGQAVTINNGDKVEVQVNSPYDFNTDLYLAITAKDFRREFHVKTEPKLYPDDIFFYPEYGIIVGETVTSNIVTVAGISDGFTSTIKVDTPGVVIYVNSGLANRTGEAVVQNGDTIQLEWVSDMAYSEIKTITLSAVGVDFGFYKVFAISLNGPVRDEVYVNWTLVAEDWMSSFRNLYVDDPYRSFSVPFADTQSDYTASNTRIADATTSYSINLAPTLLSPYALVKDITTAPNTLLPDLITSNVMYSSEANLPLVNKENVTTCSEASVPDYYKDNVNYVDRVMPSLLNSQSMYVSANRSYEASLTSYFDFEVPKAVARTENGYSYPMMLSTSWSQEHHSFAPPSSFNWSPSWWYASRSYTSENYEFVFGDPNYKSEENLNYNSFKPNLDYVVLEFGDDNYGVPLYNVIYTDYVFSNPSYLVRESAVFTSFEHLYSKLAYSVYSSTPKVPEVYKTNIGSSYKPEYLLKLSNLGTTAAPTYAALVTGISSTFQHEYQNSPSLNALHSNFGAAILTASKNDISVAKGESFVETVEYYSHTRDYVVFDDVFYGFSKIKVMEIPVIFIDMDVYPPAVKGSYDEETLQVVLDANVDYEKFVLSDGTLIYQYANKIEYGECINNRYVVEYGLVKGG